VDDDEPTGTDIYDEDNSFSEEYENKGGRDWLKWLIYSLAALAIFALGYYFGMKDVLGFNKNVTPEQAVEQIEEQEGDKRHSRLASPDAPSVKPDQVKERISESANGDIEQEETAEPKAEKKAAEPEATSKTPDAPDAPAAPAPAAKDKPAAPAAQPSTPGSNEAAPVSDANTAKYNKNARVRTGAYNIVGEDYVVTAREGDNLQKIAKRTLGADMDCYIAVFNDMTENQVLTTGQKIKIPKLKWKKK